MRLPVEDAAADFDVTITGADFHPTSVVLVDGAPAAQTQYVSPAELTATLDGALRRAAGTLTFTVQNPDPTRGDLVSGGLDLTIVPPPPPVTYTFVPDRVELGENGIAAVAVEIDQDVPAGGFEATLTPADLDAVAVPATLSFPEGTRTAWFELALLDDALVPVTVTVGSEGAMGDTLTVDEAAETCRPFSRFGSDCDTAGTTCTVSAACEPAPYDCFPTWGDATMADDGDGGFIYSGDTVGGSTHGGVSCFAAGGPSRLVRFTVPAAGDGTWAARAAPSPTS